MVFLFLFLVYFCFLLIIFINDSFSLSHKILASNVGITRFCYASLAGFHFDEELMQLLKITDTTRRPYIAIVIIILFFQYICDRIYCKLYLTNQVSIAFA